MLDLILKVIALAAFVASLATLAIWVPSLDLIVVIVVVISMAVFDLLVRPYLRRDRGG